MMRWYFKRQKQFNLVLTELINKYKSKLKKKNSIDSILETYDNIDDLDEILYVNINE